jgi:hypothetical protein
MSEFTAKSEVLIRSGSSPRWQWSMVIGSIAGIALCGWLFLGLFSLAENEETRAKTNAVRLGDLNGDGALDAFYCNGAIVPNSYNSILFNNGRGSFTYGGQRLGEANCRELSLGDLNGDGHLDAAGSGFPKLMIYINDGKGQFKATNWEYGRGIWTHAVGDLDSDGDLDILLAGCCNPEALYITTAVNQGGLQGGIEGAFRQSAWKLNALGTEAAALGDLDNDGDLDVFIANGFLIDDDYESTAAQPNMVAWNDGSGQFSDSGQRLGNSHSTAVALGDLDGDGDLDAFVGNLGPDEVWINSGGIQGGAPGVFSDSGQRLNRTRTKAVLLIDLDGDGDLDAVVTRQTIFRTRPLIYLNDGSGNFTQSFRFKWRGVLGTAFDAADLTGDGLPNIFGAGFEDQHEVSR